jgi:hypothetical protein
MEEELRRATAQASQRRLRLHPLGQAAGSQQHLQRRRLPARDQRHGARRHDALEDTEYLFFCDGPVLFFDKDNFTGYRGWEQVLQMQQAQQAKQAAE